MKTMEKEIRIKTKTAIPEGYEMDRENSTLDEIVLKPIVKHWRDDCNAKVTGWLINDVAQVFQCATEHRNISCNFNIFATKQQAESALAMARISQIMANDKRFGGPITDEEWDNGNVIKFIIDRSNNSIISDYFWTNAYSFLAFHREGQRNLFLKENEDLVRQYLMLSSESNNTENK